MAVVRKVSGWELSTIIDEYKSYAEPKVRDCDVDYITVFELASISNLWVREANFNMRSRNFFRVTLFTLVVLAIWLFSGARISSPRRVMDV